MNSTAEELLDLLKQASGGVVYLAEVAKCHVSEWTEWDRKARAAIARAEAAVAEEEKMYVQAVPDHCDRITWRGSYYHLPIFSKPAAPQPDADGWIPWAGGECPVAADAVVDVLVSDGSRALQVSCKYAYSLRWSYFPKAENILAYRIVRK